MNIAAYLKTKNFIVFALAFLIVILTFHAAFGLSIIIPTNISWLMSVRHDWGQHYLGWAFYRNEPWTFPLGEMNAICYPSGTNVGYLDAIPLVAILMKPFSSLLPEDFQYLGFWMLTCYIMVAYYTIKIFNLYNAKTFYIIAGLVLMVANPVLLFRSMHPALCAQGFIVASIYYYLKPATLQNVKSLNKYQVILVALSALITPYLCFMIMGFNFILPIKHYFYDKLLTKKQAFAYPLVSCAIVIILWVIVGMIKIGAQANLEVGESYGLYALNLNSLINSGGFSFIMPQMPWFSWHQYEGYMYLGVGIMVLIAISVIYLLLGKNYKARLLKHKYLLPLFILALCFALFAITNKISYSDHLLLEFKIPKIIRKLGGVFRACGRFFWIAYYLIYLFVILVFTKSKLKDAIKMPVLAFICILQMYDITPLFKARNLEYGKYDSPLTEDSWNKVLPSFKKMITYPPFNNHLLTGMDYQDLCFVAINNHKAISCGYSAREDYSANAVYTDSLNKAIASGQLRDDELYITTPKHLDAFSNMLHNKYLNLQYLDGYYILYTNKNKVALVQNKVALQKRDSVMSGYNETRFIKTISNPVFASSKIQYNIEDLSVKGTAIAVKGWAFENNTAGNKGDSVFVALASAGKIDIVSTKQLPRADIATAFKKPTDNVGFAAVIYSANHIKNNAMVCIAVKNAAGSWTYTQVNTLSNLTGTAPVKLNKLPATSHQIGVIDELDDQKSDVLVRGWTFFDDRSDKNTRVEVVFIGKAGNFAVAASRTVRSDVASAYPKFDYNNSGYNVRVNKKDLPAGTYTLGVLIRDTKTKEESMLTLDKTVTIK
ncbi:DUF6311 domain-containing protein [Flavobacterium subsaxonicum]|uniref:Glycosyltransferase RgtA/B/C/D-like domain-containing protein n=1 Tax=Flavobacterium subsaxonicum WB 4.1-42 = DSM 21790 TaxID=1121898 RepID=A0A0A2MMM6_9FLAO|nr:DUF6311 domain-containing protein [Flavobacterium subsaxonicum]KGO92703.1 hypothetical protein Q766_11325 [Flavobacterium subsaxonicum WB 4.1-42 = DSM 21790]